jgi:LEA14-like dessication related protein
MKKILAASGAIAGVYLLYLARQFYVVYNSPYKVSRVLIKNLTLNAVDLVLYLSITNKSDLTITVYGQHYDVLVNGTKVANVDSKNVMTLQKNNTSTLPVAMSFAPDFLLKTSLLNLATALTDKSKINIQIKGYVSAKWKSIELKNININISYTLQELIDISKKPTT